MEGIANYYLIWAVYLLAAAVFMAVFWHMTRFPRARWLAYFLRAILAAIILTPWYAHPEQTVLAPALMVAMLDAITSGGAAAGRALVPLVLALLAVLFGGGLLFLIRRNPWSKKYSKQQDTIGN